ncbi:MAG: hypothetical protein PHY82_03870 [Lentisphaeria bacterium]|nr:hypothetical protein [Lentisphaeria bacterium]
MRILWLVFLWVGFSLSAAEFSCLFSPGGWNKEDWVMVKSPRWDYLGIWEQEADHIRNKVPADATENEMLGKRAGETYTSMLWKEKISAHKKVVICAEMSFDYQMAPLLVIASEYGKDSGACPEYRQHWEIVLYDKGINVWHHQYADGKPSWYKAAALHTAFAPNQKVMMTVTINFAGKVPQLEIRADGKTFSYAELQLPKSFFVGLTACEGVNRFYSFSVTY